jgi:hypothetical protein
MALPMMDEHSVIVAAPREAVWKSVVQYAHGLTQSEHRLLGAALGAEPRSGFEISHQIDGERLELSGRHHFARYRLVFALAEQATGTLKLSAISYAVFPGARGRLYRALLLGSRGHVLAVRHMLRAISRQA